MQTNTHNIPKKLIVINDMAGVGRCSLTVALPIISACKVQACPVPTSIFSNHTGFETFYKKDLTDDLADYFSHLRKLPVTFDGIYCGYLGSSEQIDLIYDYFLDMQKDHPDCTILLDPIMGDHGKRYKAMTVEYSEALKKLLPFATVITPNITEACLLTNTPYHDGLFTTNELLVICEQLQQLGGRKIVITGMKDDTHFHNFIYQNQTDFFLHSTKISGDSRPGTGDIFASIVASLQLRGYSLFDCVATASDFISTCTSASSTLGVPIQEGVAFELYLHLLYSH